MYSLPRYQYKQFNTLLPTAYSNCQYFWFLIHAFPAFPPVLPALGWISQLNSNQTTPCTTLSDMWPEPLLCRQGFSFNEAARLFTFYSLIDLHQYLSLVRHIYFLSDLNLFMHTCISCLLCLLSGLKLRGEVDSFLDMSTARQRYFLSL